MLKEIKTPDAGSQTGSLSPGDEAAVVAGCLVLLCVATAAVTMLVCRRMGKTIKTPSLPSMPSISSLPSLPSLPRLPRRGPRATARVTGVPQTHGHIDPGFANPLYDTSPFDDGDSSFKEMAMMDKSTEQPTFDQTGAGLHGPGFSNPMYADATVAEGASGTPHDGDISRISTGALRVSDKVKNKVKIEVTDGIMEGVVVDYSDTIGIISEDSEA